MEQSLLVYMTVPDADTARRIGQDLVTAGVAACVNILPGMESIYRWQGAVERASEVVVIAKCWSGGFDALASRVRALHPYELPAIVALPIDRGLPAYLAWLVAETGGPLPESMAGDGV